jgi:hypothetical protein
VIFLSVLLSVISLFSTYLLHCFCFVFHDYVIEEGQTTQWPKEKEQKYKQRSTEHTHKTKDRVTQTPLKSGVKSGASERVISSYSTSGTSRVNLVTNPMISHE